MNRPLMILAILSGCATVPATKPDRPEPCLSTSAADIRMAQLKRDARAYVDAVEAYVACTLPALRSSSGACPRFADQMSEARKAGDGPAFREASQLYLSCTEAPDDIVRGGPIGDTTPL